LSSLPNLLSDIATSTPTIVPDTETPTTFGDEIIVNAPQYTPPVVPPIIIPPGILPPSTTPTTPTETAPPAKKDVLGTGLTATELLTAASLGSSLLGSLFGGSGSGAGATTPYVSPFGAGTGFGTGMDYRVQPAISDYERYGFGPEATFFRPEYNRLVSGAASAPAASAMPTTPIYQPLIGGEILSSVNNPSASSPTGTPVGEELRDALARRYPNQPMVSNGRYIPSNQPKPVGNIPTGAENVVRGLIG